MLCIISYIVVFLYHGYIKFGLTCHTPKFSRILSITKQILNGSHRIFQPLIRLFAFFPISYLYGKLVSRLDHLSPQLWWPYYCSRFSLDFHSLLKLKIMFKIRRPTLFSFVHLACLNKAIYDRHCTKNEVFH